MWHDEFYFDTSMPSIGLQVCYDQDEKTKTQQTSPFIAGETEFKKKALDIYGPTLGQGQTSFAGERVAPLTPTQTQATDVQGFLEQFSPYRDMPMFGEGQAALSGILAGRTGAAPITPEATEQYIEGAIADPRRKAFERFERPGIREEFAGPGFWGSARAKAVGERSQEMEDWIGQMGAQTRWDVEQANRQIEEAKAGRSLAAIEPARAYAGEPTREATARLAGRAGVFGLSGEQQAQQQRQINVAREIFAEELRETDPENLEILFALLNMQPTGGVTIRQEQRPSEFSQAANWAGVAALGYGTLNRPTGGGALGGISNPQSAASQYTLGGYGGGF